ncbi:MAG: hypothetical protein NWE80_02620 [Candidatus Bathyarchaeota archaeon]|nr:hypothetical protein [Candidatus Bathyarchaeota archaeon]
MEETKKQDEKLLCPKASVIIRTSRKNPTILGYSVLLDYGPSARDY